MDNNDNVVETAVVEDDAFLPDGWSGAEGENIFDPSTWGTNEPTADALFNGTAEEGGDSAQDPLSALAMGDRQAPQTTEAQEAEDVTNVGSPDASGKIRFQYTYDHQTNEAEIDPAELPNIYQGYMALNRYQNRVKEIEAELAQWDNIAAGLKYDNREALREGILENSIQSYMEENPAIPEEMARDFVTRKFNAQPKSREEAPSEPDSAEQPAAETTSPSGRDYRAEVDVLFSAFPEARNLPVPDEVQEEAVRNGTPLVQAYARYVTRSASAKAQEAERENKILKQNQAAAAKAPVRGVTGGGKTDTSPADDFIAGFNSDTW